MDLSSYRDLLRGKGRSDRTIQVYCGYTRRLMAWCIEHGHDPATIPPHDVRTWADEHLPLSWSSRKAAKAALAAYWSTRQDAPWEAIRVPAKPRAQYRGLTAEEARQLMQAATMHGGRPGLAVKLLLLTGARAAEVAQMTYEGVDRRAGVLSWWRQKTQDHHVLPLYPALDAALGEGVGPLFTGDGGREFVTPQTVNSWCHRVAELAGLNVTPQQVRATAGMLVVSATEDVQAAAAVLGHSDLNTTIRHYTTQVSDERLSKAMDGLAGLA